MTDLDLVSRLRAAGSVFAEDEAQLLVASFTGTALERAAARRVTGEPLEWVLGYVDFAGRRFRLDPGVFIPRQRSVALVSSAVSHCAGPDPVLVDLCCGCGALGLSVRDRVGGMLLCSDIDHRAVANARGNGAEARVGDLFESVPQSWRGRIDVAICNAPYVPSSEVALMPRDSREHEDRTLVDGGPAGLDVLERAVREAPDWLSARGHLHVECEAAQAEVLKALARTVSSREFLVTTGIGPGPDD